MNKSRNQLALEVQEGACNPYAICHVLLDAIRDAGMGQGALDDPACRLMCHQLAHLFGVYQLFTDQDTYVKLMDQCREFPGQPMERIAQNAIEGMREIQTLMVGGRLEEHTFVIALAGILKRHGYEVPS